MKKIVVTVGPSVFKENVLSDVHSANNIYRINGAHGTPQSIEKDIKSIRKIVPNADILIDLPGNKVRTKGLVEPIQVKNGHMFSLSSKQLNFPDFYKYVKRGDVALADDSTLHFVVQDVKDGLVTFLSHSDGLLRDNKGVHIAGLCEEFPFLFEKDYRLIDIINKNNISHIGLSFVRTVADMNIARELLNDKTTIVAKVETKLAVENVNDILREVDHILIDRGDLSTEIGLHKVPACQKYIIERALFWNKKVFLATQFLKNMVEQPIPTIAEVIDLHNTLKLGIYGIQLSEETAIGKYPRECLTLLHEILNELAVEVHGVLD